MNRGILLLLPALLMLGCSRSPSCREGQEMADRTYGALAPQQMVAALDAVMQQVAFEMEGAQNKRQWWDGFCDRGEQIWLSRIDRLNAGMGHQVLNPDQIEIMFTRMRSSCRE
jgi:hypothetical protein